MSQSTSLPVGGNRSAVMDEDPAMDVRKDSEEGDEMVRSEAVLSPFKAIQWQSMSPAERLARAWALRKRLVDPKAAHDAKLFPAP